MEVGRYIFSGCRPGRWTHWHDSPREAMIPLSPSTDNPGHRDHLLPTLLLAKGERHKIRIFLRAPNHKYRINNLKAAKEGETGQALEARALREELKLVKVKGWQAAAGNSGCPSRAVGQSGQEEHGATPGG